jgi:twitching motility protein PilT
MRPPLLRIKGRLIPLNADALQPKDLEEMLLSILTPAQRERLEAHQSVDVGYGLTGVARFRCNIFVQRGSYAAVFRRIPFKLPTIGELGLPEVLESFVHLQKGLVLITGPTGSGKSTTLAGMIDKINATEPVNIITLEDPIEFLFQHKAGAVRQRQLGQDFLSYGEGLKHILRQDPDVVMVGEMRDMDTISTTLTIAETGHLAFATLHTYSAAQTIDRIIDAFPPNQQNQVRSQLALTLRGVVSQQLLPKIGGGRVAAREILVNTPAVANLIRENKIPQIKNVLQTSSAEGMTTLTQDLARLIKEGKIEKEVAKQYIVGNEALGDELEGPKKKKSW